MNDTTGPGIDRIVAYENGEMGVEDTVELFSDLVRSGLAWQLQGHYGRMATAFIKAGFIDDQGNIDYATVEELAQYE